MARRANWLSVFAIALLVGCSGEPDKSARNISSENGVVSEIDEDLPNVEHPRNESGGEAPAPAQTASDGQIPPRFWGQWRTNRKSCDDRRDTMGVTISADRLLFYESEGRVKKVRETGPNALTLSADYTGEGESWSRWSSLNLTDKDELLIDDVRRVRCP